MNRIIDTPGMYVPDDVAEKLIPGLYVEEPECPYPERSVCEGCPKYIEDEDICEMEL